MYRRQQVTSGLEPKAFENPALLLRLSTVIQRGIEHHVSDEMDIVTVDPFALQILYGGSSRREEQVGNVIREYAVDFFRHDPIEGPQPSLDVSSWNVQLDRGECTGQRRVGVSVNHDLLGFDRHENRVERLDHSAGLLSVRSGSNSKVVIRIGNLEFREKHRRHIRIVVLTRMDDDLSGSARQGPMNGRELHEVGARSDDVANGQRAASFRATSSSGPPRMLR